MSVPDPVRRYDKGDVEAHRVKWIPDRWIATFAGREAAHRALAEHSAEANGIARRFIHAQANGDPVDLFLMAMAWGYKPRDYGPHRTGKVLDADNAEAKLRAIVDATRAHGATAGWHALFTHKITGLNMSFGTKLLYFAGYTTSHRPRPLVLDERVRASLDEIAPGTVPPTGRVVQADYLRYLELAESWASEPYWKQEPDVVEYALFKHEPKPKEAGPHATSSRRAGRSQEKRSPLCPSCNIQLPASGVCTYCN